MSARSHPATARRAAATLAIAAVACTDDAPPAPTPTTTAVAALVPIANFPAIAYVGDVVAPKASVVARDATGRPIAGVAVRFDVGAGGGTIEQATVVTDGTGIATESRWTLGDGAGANVLVATAGSARTELRVDARPATARWTWRRLGRPLGDSLAVPVLVDPNDASVVYAANIARGLYVSRDGGSTWTASLTTLGVDAGTLQADPRDPRRLWVAPLPDVLTSGDQGRTWTVRARLSTGGGRSLLVSSRDGAIFVGAQAEGDIPGIHRSTDDGRTWTFHPFGAPAGTRLIPWQIAEDASGTLYVGCEIADHPTPYRPPLYRSTDRGLTWQDVGGTLPWHVLRLGIDAKRNRVLAMTEGAGLYESGDRGATWRWIGRPFGADFTVDPRDPDRLYGGDFTLYGLPGGAYRSSDAGATWERIGFPGRQVGGLALTPTSDRLYVGVPFDGIYVADVR